MRKKRQRQKELMSEKSVVLVLVNKIEAEIERRRARDPSSLFTLPAR